MELWQNSAWWAQGQQCTRQTTSVGSWHVLFISGHAARCSLGWQTLQTASWLWDVNSQFFFPWLFQQFILMCTRVLQILVGKSSQKTIFIYVKLFWNTCIFSTGFFFHFWFFILDFWNCKNILTYFIYTKWTNFPNFPILITLPFACVS